MPLIVMAAKVFMSQAAFSACDRRVCLTLPNRKRQAGKQRAVPAFEELSASAGDCPEGLEGSGNPWAEQHVPGRCLPSNLPPPGTYLAPCDSPRRS